MKVKNLVTVVTGASQGLGKEIAREFVVAVSTIKTHVNNIFVKLSVHSRTQAVARAKELGLSL